MARQDHCAFDSRGHGSLPSVRCSLRPLGKLIIGWSGLNSGFKYLLGIEGALVEVLSKYQDAIFQWYPT